MLNAEQNHLNWQLELEHASGEYDVNLTAQNAADLVAAVEGFLESIDELAKQIEARGNK